MAWIESHTLILRHRKLISLAKELRLKPVYCLGHLHALWHAAMEQAEDGDLSSWSDEFIAESAGFQGDVTQFVSLLQLHGWLDGKILHDWLDYAGRFLRGKYSTRGREKLVEIWAKHGRVYGNADNLPTQSRQVADKLPTPTIPNLTVPNQTKPKEKDIGAKFAPPSVSEVEEFIAEKGFKGFDPLSFVNFYESKGWMVGKTRMKNWRASVICWHYRNLKGGFNGVGNYQTNRIGATPVPGKYANISS